MLYQYMKAGIDTYYVVKIYVNWVIFAVDEKCESQSWWELSNSRSWWEKQFQLLIVIARQLFFHRLSPLPSSRVRLQLQLREWIFPMSAFCICFCWPKHLKTLVCQKERHLYFYFEVYFALAFVVKINVTILLKNVTKLEMSCVTNLLNHQLLWQI